jgi:branched-chain amino acid transport system ATP-binding protein
MSFLEIQDIHTYYGESHVLQGVSLSVGHSSVIAVLGRNGVGKTTLIRSVMGFLVPLRGKIIFEGRDITHLRTFHIAKLGIGLVPQGRLLFPSLSTKEHLDIAMRSRQGGLFSSDRVLSMFPRLKERLKSSAGKLSGGEQQMLAIARALVGNPDLLLMDEPSEGLAPLIVQEVGHVIDEIKKHNISILLVEQNLPFTLKRADYIYVMNRGKVVHASNPAELTTEVKSCYLGV